MLYIIPFAFLFSGIAFPLALNIYWFTSNLWTMGQQYIVIKNMPTPGSDAWRARLARLQSKGKLAVEGEAAKDGEASAAPAPGQRQQPMSKKRAKKQSGSQSPQAPQGKPGNAGEQRAADDNEGSGK
jgi:YidC/Oxa1 family membrane protein insertase